MGKFFDVAIIGGGPAGMMAAISASANNGIRVCLLEKNKSLGKKLLLTGKGRCNITSSKDISEIVEKYGKRGGFYYSALTQFSNRDLINFFNERGVKTVVERGDRVFPQSGKADMVLECLIKELKKGGVVIEYFFEAAKIIKNKAIFEITSSKNGRFFARNVLICTGGMSYPATGSTGDGYQFAKQFGHTITPLSPALAALIVNSKKIRLLAGLSLKNINLTVLSNKKKVADIFGEMLFTHTGISGPIVLTISKQVYSELAKKNSVEVSLDLKPALDEKKLKRRIQREIEQIGKKEYRTFLMKLLPKSLISLTMDLTAIDRHKKVGSLTRKEQERLISFLKDFKFKIDQVAPIESAIVTSGGLSITEIESKTMQSKIVPGLFFAGEVIELEGPTGGFNLQEAFSTGWVAGKLALEERF